MNFDKYMLNREKLDFQFKFKDYIRKREMQRDADTIEKRSIERQKKIQKIEKEFFESKNKLWR